MTEVGGRTTSSGRRTSTIHRTGDDVNHNDHPLADALATVASQTAWTPRSVRSTSSTASRFPARSARSTTDSTSSAASRCSSTPCRARHWWRCAGDCAASASTDWARWPTPSRGRTPGASSSHRTPRPPTRRCSSTCARARWSWNHPPIRCVWWTTSGSGTWRTWGLAGPDKGAGGKYLYLPPDFDGDVPRRLLRLSADHLHPLGGLPRARGGSTRSNRPASTG